VRIASANLLHGVDVRRLAPGTTALPRSAVDLDAVAGWLADLDADVIAVQEVDRDLDRSGGVDQVAWLADRLGLDGVFGPALHGDPEVGWAEVPDAGLPAGAPAYGIGLLSRSGLRDVRRHRLPHGGPGSRQPGASPVNPGVDGEPRIARSATVDGPGGRPLRITTTHLSYMPWRAVPQLGHALAAAVAGHDGPAVLIGDLNLPMWGGWLALRAHGLHPWAWPGGATTRAGWRHLQGLATYPSWRPRVQLDQAYVRHVADPVEVAVGPPGPSDHLPLLLTLPDG
jgi:endonuclease/exonuclease/phosphatase family metal-dependent hydrolase